MKKYNEWLCEQEGNTVLENVKLMLNGTKLMIECEGGNSFDLELDEEQAADLTEKMNGCAAAGDEEGGGEEGLEDQGPEGMDDQTPAPPQMGRPGLGEGKMNFGKACKKCKKLKCICNKKCSGV